MQDLMASDNVANILASFLALEAYAIWVGVNMLFTLALALNVSRWRIKQATHSTEEVEKTLRRAIRAHGNNIEYVPFMLLGIGVLCLLGHGAIWMHTLGVALLLARLLQAHGIYQEVQLPKTRVIGNFLTWILWVIIAVTLIVETFL